LSRTKKTIVDKLADVFKAVERLQRVGTNHGHKYPFTRATDVFEAVREGLFSRGVLILPNEDKPEYVAIATSNGGEQITECRLGVAYTFKDATGELGPFKVHGVGRDVEDKALYKAQTGAEKALLKRMGLMAEEVDDPEFDGQAETGKETLDDIAPPRLSRKDKPLIPGQISAIREGVANTQKSAEQLSQAVATIGRAEVLEKVQQRHFLKLLSWATDGQGTLNPAPKPQAAPMQNALPLRAAPAPIEMKIGNKSISFEPKSATTFSV
jgi:hypothetical protein